MFRFAADRFPVACVLTVSLIDFTVYLLADNIWWLAGYALLSIIPKGLICAWNHHHQHSVTFHAKFLNRILEFFYALHTGVTTNLWVLHHVLGHHRNFLDQTRDESAWKRSDGEPMSAWEYTLTIAGTPTIEAISLAKSSRGYNATFSCIQCLRLSASRCCAGFASYRHYLFSYYQ